MSSFMFSFYFSHKNRLVFLFIIFVRRFLFICFYLFFTLCFLAQYVLPVVIIYHSRRLILLSDGHVLILCITLLTVWRSSWWSGIVPSCLSLSHLLFRPFLFWLHALFVLFVVHLCCRWEWGSEKECWRLADCGLWLRRVQVVLD